MHGFAFIAILCLTACSRGLTSTPQSTRTLAPLEGAPAWSPDGEWIAFTRRVGAAMQGHIHVMRADGSEHTRLVGEPGEWNDCCALWRPAQVSD